MNSISADVYPPVSKKSATSDQLPKKQPKRKKVTKKGTTITDTAHKIVSKYLKRRRKTAITEMNYGLTAVSNPSIFLTFSQTDPSLISLPSLHSASESTAPQCANCFQELKTPNCQTHQLRLHFGYKHLIRVCSECYSKFQQK